MMGASLRRNFPVLWRRSLFSQAPRVPRSCEDKEQSERRSAEPLRSSMARRVRFLSFLCLFCRRALSAARAASVGPCSFGAHFWLCLGKLEFPRDAGELLPPLRGSRVYKGGTRVTCSSAAQCSTLPRAGPEPCRILGCCGVAPSYVKGCTCSQEEGT